MQAATGSQAAAAKDGQSLARLVGRLGATVANGSRAIAQWAAIGARRAASASAPYTEAADMLPHAPSCLESLVVRARVHPTAAAGKLCVHAQRTRVLLYIHTHADGPTLAITGGATALSHLAGRQVSAIRGSAGVWENGKERRPATI